MTLRHGYYRATVTAVNAVNSQVQITCSDLYGPNAAVWAQAMAPAAALILPTVGDQVWLGFEKGDDFYPLWIGIVP